MRHALSGRAKLDCEECNKKLTASTSRRSQPWLNSRCHDDHEREPLQHVPQELSVEIAQPRKHPIRKAVRLY
jgi:hypothetical protein